MDQTICGPSFMNIEMRRFRCITLSNSRFYSQLDTLLYTFGILFYHYFMENGMRQFIY